jgi:hypothetical protein
MKSRTLGVAATVVVETGSRDAADDTATALFEAVASVGGCIEDGVAVFGVGKADESICEEAGEIATGAGPLCIHTTAPSTP